jgi:hypothetical protein
MVALDGTKLERLYEGRGLLSPAKQLEIDVGLPDVRKRRHERQRSLSCCGFRFLATQSNSHTARNIRPAAVITARIPAAMIASKSLPMFEPIGPSFGPGPCLSRSS